MMLQLLCCVIFAVSCEKQIRQGRSCNFNLATSAQARVIIRIVTFRRIGSKEFAQQRIEQNLS